MTRFPRAVAAAILFLSIFCIVGPDPTLAQPTPPIGALLPDGAAVVTGFSGAQPPTVIAPGVNPADKIFIDLNGPSVRVIDILTPGAPPQGQVIGATKLFTATAGQIGQVFGVALDNATPPNIYVAATSVYGLPIVTPGGGGEPARAQQGGPNARFMPGLFGPEAQQGGPGSIWRIDGVSGSVGLFANVTLDGAANSGPALGGLAFDPTSNSLFVADRESGMIHRFDMTGAERGRYDHGTQGRQAAGLPAVAFDPGKRVDITTPQFNSENPDTWGYADPARRIFGLAVHSGRLFYAVAEPVQIWSVSAGPDGSFGNDARMEVAIPESQTGTEISKIAFDDQGSMLLAERPLPTGAYDFAALAGPGAGRVLRFQVDAQGHWQVAPDEYAIGFAGQFRNANGGVAVAYGYDSSGKLDTKSCGAFLWSTGEQLRRSADPNVVATLGEPAAINGLQGNGVDAVRPANAPPLQAYFVSYVENTQDADARGHLGDIAIARSCAPGAAPATVPAGGPLGPQGPGEGLPAPQFGPGEEPGPGEGPGLNGFWPDPLPPICPAGTYGNPNAITCCPPGQIPGNDGQCRGHCNVAGAGAGPNKACDAGFQFNAGATSAGPGGGNPGAGAVCWNNTAPTAIAGCPPPLLGTYLCRKCPAPPNAQCQTGFTFRTPAELGAVPPQNWEWSNGTCVPNAPNVLPCNAAGNVIGNNGACHADICPAGWKAFPVTRCCLNGTQPDVHGNCGPGFFVQPHWDPGYQGTGLELCWLPGDCSFYEFTITGRGNYFRGALTQHIKLPQGSDFPQARITRGSKYCPASAWSCSKSGDGFTCSAQDCGIEPGDQVVLRIEGKLFPGVTQAPPTPIKKTVCGVLEWDAKPGRGAAEIAQPGDFRVTPRSVQTPAGTVTKYGPPPTKEACVETTAKAPECYRGYTRLLNGQCCLASQVTRGGECCPSGQRPDARGEQCVGQPLTRTCGPNQAGVWPNCCPLGRYWDGKRCVEPPTRGCPPDSVGTPPDCRCRPPLIGRPGSCTRPIVACPRDTVGTPPDCRPIKPERCPRGTVGTPPDCRPSKPERCPRGMIGTPPDCRPIRPLRCPRGMIGTPPDCRRMPHLRPMQRNEPMIRRGTPFRRGGPD